MCVAAMVLFSASAATAGNVTLRVSQLSGDLTTALRQRVATLGPADNLLLYFDKAGSFTLNGTVEFNCNVEIKGLGSGKTTIVLNDGTPAAGFKPFTDDCFLKLNGTPSVNHTFSMHDIAVRLRDHKGIWWQDAEKLAVKLYDASRVDIYNVYSYMSNAVCTNFDLRSCDNVTVKNCTIINYNNCNTGGNLWLRANMKNVLITGNKFYKYGNDEALAFFELENNGPGLYQETYRSNINVTDNDFYYTNGTHSKTDVLCSVLFTFFYSEDGSVAKGGHTQGLHVRNNNFYIDDPLSCIMSLTFWEHDTHSDVVISDNHIENRANSSDRLYYHQDIGVKDLASTPAEIVFENCTTINNADFVSPYKDSGYTHLLVSGANVKLSDCTFTDNVSSSRLTSNKLGASLIWFTNLGGTVTLSNCVTSGTRLLATVSFGDGINKNVAINATGCTFNGGSTIYCNKVKHLDLNFTDNTFNSPDNMGFFLQEFANEGSVVFKDNTVTSSGGQLMTHWSSVDNHHFTRLEVTGNTFRGVNGQADLLKNIKSVSRRNVSGNIYYR